MLKNILYPKNYINTLTRSRNIMSLASLADRKIFKPAPVATSPPGYLAAVGTPPPPSTRNITNKCNPIITDFHHIKFCISILLFCFDSSLIKNSICFTSSFNVSNTKRYCVDVISIKLNDEFLSLDKIKLLL